MYWIEPKHWIDLLKLKWLHCYFVLALECTGPITDTLFHFWPLRLVEYSTKLEGRPCPWLIDLEKNIEDYLIEILCVSSRWHLKKEQLDNRFKCKNKTELVYYAGSTGVTIYPRKEKNAAYAEIRIRMTGFCTLSKEIPGAQTPNEIMRLGTHALQISHAIDEFVWICESGLPLIGEGIAFDRRAQYKARHPTPERRTGKTTAMASWAAALIKHGLMIGDQSETVKSRCSVCRKTSTFHCGRCKQQNYCDPVCQKADWPTHKHNCKK